MTYLNKRIFLKSLDNNLFTNKYLNRSLYFSNKSSKTNKSNKNINLSINKNKKKSFEMSTILKNLNKNYIEKNILQKNDLVSTSQQTNSSMFNKKLNKLNNMLINKNNDNKYISRNYSFINNINFHRFINSNDININFRKISRNNSFLGVKNNKKNEKYNFINRLQNSRMIQNDLFNSHLINGEQNLKRVHLKKLRIKNDFKTIHYKPITAKNLSHLNSNKNKDSTSDDSFNIIFSMIKLNRDRSAPKFFHRVNKNPNINLSSKFQLSKKIILYK